MRTGSLFAGGLVAAMVVGCSNPAADSVIADEAFAAELELALSAAAGSEVATLSPLEITRSNEPGEAPAATPAPRTPARAPAAAVDVALLGEPVMATVVEQAVAPAPRPVETEPVGQIAAANGGDADRAGRADSDGRRPSAGKRPGISIRGGVSVRGGGCATGLPGRGGLAGVVGAVGAMINDRSPTGIGRATGGYPGDSRGPISRAGGGFAGGIR